MRLSLLLAAPLLVVAAPAAAQSYAVEVAVGQGRLIRLAVAADSVVVANPETADVQMPQSSALFVFGKAAGVTTVQAFARDGRLIANVEVTVAPDLAKLREGLASMPGARAAAGNAGAVVLLQGEVANPAQAAAATALARAAAGKAGVGGDMTVAMPTQVNLRVRIAEVSRTLTRELGFNWESLIGLGTGGGAQLLVGIGRDFITEGGIILRSPTGAESLGYIGGGGDLNAVVDALAQDGLITVLAEPNLTARSGETASFLSGGEFPIPINTRDDAIVVEFKQFGVSLDFTPTVLDEGRISIKVRPEVSELNQASGVEINGLKIPGISVRRAETTVELASGQSFAIAGLVQANSANTVRALPGLSDIPILGALFRSTRFQRQETELVIMVTPYLVRPVAPARLAVPTDAVDPATGFRALVTGKLDAKPPQGVRAADDVGFILE